MKKIKVRKLWIDQYGNKYYAYTLKELREMVDGGRVSKMYIDDKEGNTRQIGYVIGHQWLECYVPYTFKGDK